MLLRALQSNGMVHRRNAFASIRHCRRRRHADWRQHSVARVLTTEDEYQILHLRALLARVCRLMARRRLSPAAFFAACDRDRDAHVSWSELQTGLRWLGLSALDETVVELFLFLRKGALADATDGPPLLSRRDFLDAVEQEGAAAADWHDEPPGDVGEESSAAPPPPIRTESGAAAPAAPVAGDGEAWADAPPLGEPAEATAEGTSSIRTQLCRLGDFERVWDSTAGGAGGGGGRQKGAVWAPSLRGDSILRGASVKICLGHYALAGAVKPGRMFSGAPQRTVEVTDTPVALEARRHLGARRAGRLLLPAAGALHAALEAGGRAGGGGPERALRVGGCATRGARRARHGVHRDGGAARRRRDALRPSAVGAPRRAAAAQGVGRLWRLGGARLHLGGQLARPHRSDARPRPARRPLLRARGGAHVC